MHSLNTLTDRDVELLRELVRDRRSRRANTAQRPYYPEDDAKAPDVYVAKTTSVLPALADHGTTGTGTGTGVEPGTGTADIYRADLNDYGERRLHAMGPNLLVYNLLSSDVASGSWVLVERDKWGLWWTAQPALVSGGGSTGGSSGSVGSPNQYTTTGTGGTPLNNGNLNHTVTISPSLSMSSGLHVLVFNIPTWMSSSGINGTSSPCQFAVSVASGSATITPTSSTDITPPMTFDEVEVAHMDHTVVYYVDVTATTTITVTMTFPGSTFAGVNWHIKDGNLSVLQLR